MLNINKTVRTASFMMVAVLMSKLCGMVRDILIAAIYGTSPEAIAFSTASHIPNYFFDIGLTAAVSSVFIPVFNEYLEKKDNQKALEFSNTFLNIVLIISAAITVFGIIAARPIVTLIAGGLQYETFNLTVQLVKILFPLVVFVGIAFTFVGILHSYDEFNVPAVISLAFNIIVILYLVLLNKKFGIHGLAVAMVVGWISQAMVQIPSLVKHGYKYRPIINFKNPGIKKAGRLVLPFLICTWVQPVNAMVNIHLASWLYEGKAVVALDYANKVYIIIVGVFIYALSNLIFPSLSRTKVSEKADEYVALLKNALRVVFYFITPLMIGFMILRYPIIRLVYERGAFDSYSTDLTSTALLFYSIGMLGFAVQEIMNKAYFASQDAKVPMNISILGMIINIILSFILSKVFGLSGIALAASIASISVATFLLIFMARRHKGLVDKQFFYDFVKILAASSVMGIIVHILHLYFTQTFDYSTILSKLLAVVIPGLVGIAIYMLITLLMGLKIAKLPFRIFKRSPE